MRTACLAIGLILAAAACTESSPTTDAGVTTTTSFGRVEDAPGLEVSPDGYAIDGDALDGAHRDGEILGAEEVDEPWVPESARAWRMLYRSTGVDGGPVAVSGVIVVPTVEPPADGFPVLSWAHGTTGVADHCAPSLRDRPPAPFLGALLEDGWVVVATDYEGLGTPGVHPYLVGRSAGRSVLDAARAARSAGGSDEVVFAGHSQGGHAALWAGEIADAYAPELQVGGVVAGAPAAELADLLDAAVSSPLALGFLAMAGVAYEAVYPEIDLSRFLTPEGVAALGVVEEECVSGVLTAWAGIAPEALSSNPLDDAAVVQRIRENIPGRTPPSSPVLVVQGEADLIVPARTTDRAVERLCRAGATVQYERYEGESHSSVVNAARDAVLEWVAARRAGQAAPSSC